MKGLFACLSVGAAMLLGTSNAAVAQNPPFIGQILLFAGSYCPSGWLAANGQLLPASSNQVLYSVIGTRYGGNSVNFALPNAKPFATLTAGATFIVCIATTGLYPPRP